VEVFYSKKAKYFFFKMMKIRENNRIRTIAFVGLFSIMDQNRSKLRRVRSVWVKEYRRRFGHLPLISELRENYPDDFKNYLRMDSACFDMLLALVGPKICKTDTIMRKCISVEERLTATLR